MNYVRGGPGHSRLSRMATCEAFSFRLPPALWLSTALLAWRTASSLSQPPTSSKLLTSEPLTERESSCRTTLSNELCTSRCPLYSMKPMRRNLFMKELTRDRVVPIISARVSWLIFATTGCGLPRRDRWGRGLMRIARSSGFPLSICHAGQELRFGREQHSPAIKPVRVTIIASFDIASLLMWRSFRPLSGHAFGGCIARAPLTGKLQVDGAEFQRLAAETREWNVS
jgi:hypothetical protein